METQLTLCSFVDESYYNNDYPEGDSQEEERELENCYGLSYRLGELVIFSLLCNRTCNHSDERY